jgi:hypothetical protein
MDDIEMLSIGVQVEMFIKSGLAASGVPSAGSVRGIICRITTRRQFISL